VLLLLELVLLLLGGKHKIGSDLTPFPWPKNDDIIASQRNGPRINPPRGPADNCDNKREGFEWFAI
jgi:hypothetical protein